MWAVAVMKSEIVNPKRALSQGVRREIPILNSSHSIPPESLTIFFFAIVKFGVGVIVI
jgi:hypothetical protein